MASNHQRVSHFVQDHEPEQGQTVECLRRVIVGEEVRQGHLQQQEEEGGVHVDARDAL
jgi:hypothetical protein